MAVIYKITNTVNGKFYIGSSVSYRTRCYEHRTRLRKGDHHCQPLQRAWVKYGAAAFTFEVVEHVPEGEDHLAVEARWLNEHHGRTHCYNVSKNPYALWIGRRHTDATKAKLAEAQKGKRHRLGHTNSSEHRERISSAMKGKKKSPEHVEKIRQRMMGTSYAKGRVVTDEQRAAMGHAVIETTQGLEFSTVTAAAAHFGLGRPNLVRTLRGDGLVKRGPHRGLHFQHAPSPAPENVP